MEKITLNFLGVNKEIGVKLLTPSLKTKINALKVEFEQKIAEKAQSVFNDPKLMSSLNLTAEDAANLTQKLNSINMEEVNAEIDGKSEQDKQKYLLDKGIMSAFMPIFERARSVAKEEFEDWYNVELIKLSIIDNQLSDTEKELLKQDYNGEFWQNQACEELAKAQDCFPKARISA